MSPRSASEWSSKLTRPIKLRKGRTLKTLSDVRSFILSLPQDRQRSPTWAAVTEELLSAAKSGSVDLITVMLEMLLYLEGRRDNDGTA